MTVTDRVPPHEQDPVVWPVRFLSVEEVRLWLGKHVGEEPAAEVRIVPHPQDSKNWWVQIPEDLTVGDALNIHDALSATNALDWA